MSVDLWVPVVAALGASALTGSVALGIEWIRLRSERTGERQRERRQAYAQLLTMSGLIAHTAHAYHITMQFRSGLSEAVNVTMRQRKPVDPLEVDDRLRRDAEPLYAAWSSVWVVGSPAAVASANRLIDRTGAVMGTATARGEARVGLARCFLARNGPKRSSTNGKTADWPPHDCNALCRDGWHVERYFASTDSSPDNVRALLMDVWEAMDMRLDPIRELSDGRIEYLLWWRPTHSRR